MILSAAGCQPEVASEEWLRMGNTMMMGLKRKSRKETTNNFREVSLGDPMLPSPSQSGDGINVEVQAEAGGNAVKNLFEGNYEDRRKFGVVDIFDTLGFAVSAYIILFQTAAARYYKNTLHLTR